MSRLEDNDYHIGWAVYKMEMGQRVRRRAWRPYIWINLILPNSNICQPYVQIHKPDNKCFPWVCSQEDLLAKDWELD